MRKIKFRGRDLDTGRFVYGHFIVEACGLPAIITTCPAATYEVDPKSVAQLVGYDADGNEVYEGDEIVAKNGSTWVAVLNATVTLPEFANRSREPLKVNGFKLKEV